MKQIEKETHAIPGYDALTGNDEARKAAEKIKANIDSIVVDKDALMRAERNDVLDAAIARFDGGKQWIRKYLAKDDANGADLANSGQPHNRAITIEDAARMRQRGDGFCLIGSLGAQEGIHSHEAIDEAVSAVRRAIGNYGGIIEGKYNYGYSHGNIYEWNDRQTEAGPVIAAMQKAKSQPLSKSYNE